MFYKELHDAFLSLLRDKKLLDEKIIIKTRILNSKEAIGNPDRKDFPLLKGKEVLMSATFLNKEGQAYTDAPSEFSGKVKDIVKLPLDDIRNRALFIASLNAVMRHVYPDLTTIHCKDNEPEECSAEIVKHVRQLNPERVGIVGLQPAILEAIAGEFGPENIQCIDRDEDYIGQSKFNVPIKWGDTDNLEELCKASDVILATGSTVVNGSISDILQLAQKYGHPVYFYGTTVAGTAALMKLNRLCFRSK